MIPLELMAAKVREAVRARREAEGLDPPDDVHASGRYRKRVIVEMIVPMRQPVTLNVFDAPLIVIVRSAMSGSVAIGMCSPS